MRLFKRGQTYWYELVFEGKRIQRSTKSKNQRIAGQVASAFHVALIKGDVGIVDRKPVPGFKAATKAFLEWSAHEHQAKPETADRYRVSSLPLLRFFKDAQLDRITPEDVEGYKLSRSAEKAPQSKKRLRPATVNRELACLRRLFNYMAKSLPDLRNPVSRVKFLDEDNLQTRVLTWDEQRRYLAKATKNLRDIAGLILETGMRPGEVFELESRHVDLFAGYLRVIKSKTPAGRRRIELTPAAREILQRRLPTGDDPYFFPSRIDRKRPLGSLQGAHAKALRDSKVAEFRLYDLRHCWATRAAEAGVDLVTLAAMMGHSRIQMVLRYAHPTQEHQASAMEQVQRHNTVQREKAEEKAWQEEQLRSKGRLQVVPRTA